MTGVDTAGGSFQGSQLPLQVNSSQESQPPTWSAGLLVITLPFPLDPVSPVCLIITHIHPLLKLQGYVTGEKMKFQESQWTFLKVRAVIDILH